MALRNRILLAALALSTAAVSLPAAARTYVDIEIAPPPPQVEIVPGPRVGYVWATRILAMERPQAYLGARRLDPRAARLALGAAALGPHAERTLALC